MTFQELALFLSSGDWLSLYQQIFCLILMGMVRVEPEIY
jgi:hypothetical protein